MHTLYRIIFLIILFPSLLFGQSSAETKVRQKAKFNSDWKFILDDKTGFESPAFNDSTWRSLDLPHDWSVEGKFDTKNPAGGQGAYLPCGIGWYRKSFVIPDSLKNKRVVIQFDGIYMNSKVYINGHFLGQYPYGYSTFQYDLTDLIQFGKPNLIAVRVDNSLQPSSRWYSGSGIYRNVWLVTTNPVHFDNYSGVFVSFPEVGKENATVKVQYNITANAFPDTDFQWWRRNTASNKRITKVATLTSTIFDSNGKLVAKGIIKENITDFNEYYLRKSYWSNEPVVRIAVETNKSPSSDWHPRKTVSHWNHKWNGGYLLPVYVYSNCDEIELRLNDSVIGRKAVDKNLYYAHWDLPFRSGKIQATGYKNNRKATEHTLTTAGNAVGMSISANKTTLVANREDVVLLELTLVDENGVPVPDAGNEITVEVTGPAKLFGLDNGNQSDVTAFRTNTRKAFEGKILITIQATQSEGTVKVTTNAAGIKSAVYSLQSVLGKI